MKKRLKISAPVLNTFLFMLFITLTCKMMAQSPISSSTVNASSLVGTWTLTAADNLQSDGSRGPAYGPSPQGI
jgi:hypothetical protein